MSGKFRSLSNTEVFRSFYNMDKLFEIIRGRQAPGVLIFDQNQRLLYSNPEALELIPGILPAESAGGDSSAVPAEMVGLCRQVGGVSGDDSPGRECRLEKTCALMSNGRQQMVSMRAFLLNRHGDAGGAYHVMVLVEKVVENHRRDFAKIQQEYNLSRRELDVLRELCAGLTNRAIAEKLFISEHTVKDHLKHIMKKLNVSSRNGILAALSP